MPEETELIYLTDSYQKTATATVTAIEDKGNQVGLNLDQTIFYPQGGGQPSDTGMITGDNGSFTVSHVSYNHGNPLHLGKMDGDIKIGDTVELKIDWDKRYKHMQWHTAGHILDEAVKELYDEIHGVNGQHGISNKCFVDFNQSISTDQIDEIEEQINQIIDNKEPITVRMVTKKEIEAEGIQVPFKLPEDKPLRLIQIGERLPVPDGGTQLKDTGESWHIELDASEPVDGNTRLHYIVSPKKDIESEEPTDAISLSDFSNQVNAIIAAFSQETDISQNTHAKYLGKNGLINQLSQQIPHLPETERPAAGKQLNQLKKDIQEKIDQSQQDTSDDTQWLDVTQPGTTPTIGHLHPITQAINEIQSIFENLGFTRVRHPEVDWDYYVFEALNMPQDHPARDEWETFFVQNDEHNKWGKMVLTTHTSNGQVREMERLGGPPIRMLNIGKSYRRQQDVTHTAMFHQFEGLVVDEGITIQDLKGTIEYFAKHYYGDEAEIRLRPHNFKFTEPSFEVDFLCTICHGTTTLEDGSKCQLCKSGWLEVAGAGMVHPNVLKAGNIDPTVYTGFAFGMGVERAYTLKPGLQLDDIRPFYGNNLEFLEQF